MKKLLIAAGCVLALGGNAYAGSFVFAKSTASGGSYAFAGASTSSSSSSSGGTTTTSYSAKGWSSGGGGVVLGGSPPPQTKTCTYFCRLSSSP